MKKHIRLTLDKKLKRVGMTRYRLSQLTEIKYQTLDKYYKNQVTRYDSHILLKICLALDCPIGDILNVR